MGNKNVQRFSNIELLRFVAMFMIVLSHTGFGTLSFYTSAPWYNQFVAWFPTPLGKIGVNIFFLISGFFMIKSERKIVKVIRLTFQIITCNILVFCFLTFLLNKSYTLNEVLDMIPYVRDVSDSFITSYLFLYLLTPFINRVLQNLTQKEYQYVLFLLFIYFIVLPFISKENVFNYLFWGIFVYMIGAYIRLYKMCENTKSLRVIALLWFSLYVCVESVASYFGYAHKAISLCPANTFFSISSAVLLFLYFKNTKLKYKSWINTIGQLSFGILLLHSNNQILRDWLWVELLKYPSYIHEGYFCLYVLITVVAIYTICAFVEYLRIRLIEEPLFSKLNKQYGKRQ